MQLTKSERVRRQLDVHEMSEASLESSRSQMTLRRRDKALDKKSTARTVKYQIEKFDKQLSTRANVSKKTPVGDGISGESNISVGLGTHKTRFY